MQQNLTAQVNGVLQSPKVQAVIQNPTVQASQQWVENFYWSKLTLFKAGGLLISIVFIASTLFFAIRTGWLPTRIDRAEDVFLKKNLPKRKSKKGWSHIQKHFFKGDDNSLKIAIIEADKILDDALKAGGFRGENLGERLKKVGVAQFPNLQDIWEAHKLRNRMVHETDFKLSRDIAEKALGVYERTFKDLGLIDPED